MPFFVNFFRRRLRHSEALQKEMICIMCTKTTFLSLFFEKVIFLELFPPEAASQRSPTKSGQIFSGQNFPPIFFWPDFPGQIFRSDFFGTIFVTNMAGEYFFGTFWSTRNCFFKQMGSGATLVLGVGPEKLLQSFTP